MQTIDPERLGKWQDVESYLGRYYGSNGNELGKIPISIAPQMEGDTVVSWVVAETPDEATIFHGSYNTKKEARIAAKELAEELDETPDLEELIEEIKETNYFEDPDIIPFVVKAMTEYSQGYLLITPSIHHPVGVAWTTNGYLQCDYLGLSATFDTEEQAAETLLSAIRELNEKNIPA